MDRRGEHNRICLAVITGAHGLRGQVRLKSFTEKPEDVAAYGALADEAGATEYRVKIIGANTRGQLLAALDGVTDRNGAEALKGTRLFVDRDRLPPPDVDEYYASDLEGLDAELPDGSPLGRVHGVQDFGAGDVLEIRSPTWGSVMVPFTEAIVPVIDLDAGRLVVDPPPGTLEPASPEEQAAEASADALDSAEASQ